MIKSSIERVARARYVMPVVLALAIVALVVNEGTYRYSLAAMERAIALTDARRQAALTLQYLTDAESAARAYLINGQDADLKAYRTALEALAKAQRGAFQHIADADPQHTLSVHEVREHIETRVMALESWMTNTERGQRGRAQTLASSDQSRQDHAELREAFDHVLGRAAEIQQRTRISLLHTLMLNRVALHGLVLISVLTLLLFMRQLRESDARKAQESEHLAREISERTATLRQLAGHLVNAREDERGRVARELHDELGGLFTATKLELARLRRVPDLPAAAQQRLHGIEQRLNEGIAVKRRIIENLRPSSLEQLGLISALKVLCQDAAASLNIPVAQQLEPVALDRESELTVYRVVQESLTNISKYAQARQVWVSLARHGSGWARVTVRDDGRGFDPERVQAGRHGLLGMRVRVESHAGRLSITSAPGKGTRVEAELPMARGTGEGPAAG